MGAVGVAPYEICCWYVTKKAEAESDRRCTRSCTGCMEHSRFWLEHDSVLLAVLVSVNASRRQMEAGPACHQPLPLTRPAIGGAAVGHHNCGVAVGHRMDAKSIQQQQGYQTSHGCQEHPAAARLPDVAWAQVHHSP